MAYVLGGSAAVAAWLLGQRLYTWWSGNGGATGSALSGAGILPAVPAVGSFNASMSVHLGTEPKKTQNRPVRRDTTAPSLHHAFLNEIQTFFNQKSLRPVSLHIGPSGRKGAPNEIEMLLLCELDRRNAAWNGRADTPALTESCDAVEVF